MSTGQTTVQGCVVVRRIGAHVVREAAAVGCHELRRCEALASAVPPAVDERGVTLVLVAGDGANVLRLAGRPPRSLGRLLENMRAFSAMSGGNGRRDSIGSIRVASRKASS